VGLENPTEETTHHKVPLPGRIRGRIGNLRRREVHGKKLGHSGKRLLVLFRIVLMKHEEVCGWKASCRDRDRATKNIHARKDSSVSLTKGEASRGGEIHNAQSHYL
jgi:hypothetical protein